MVINIYTNANNLKKFYLGKLVQQKCGNFEVDDSNGFTKIIWPEKQVTIMIFPILPKYYKIAVPTYFYVDEYELNIDDVKTYLESKDCISLPSFGDVLKLLKTGKTCLEKLKEDELQARRTDEFDGECLTVDSLKTYLEKLSEAGHGDAMIFMGKSAPIHRDALCFEGMFNRLTICNTYYDRKLADAMERAKNDLQRVITTYLADCYDAGI